MPLRQHLLIVDDQRVDRAIGTHAANQIGYRVSCAASIEETRALLETGNHFDFVVLDLALGAEDGLEVLPLIARFDSCRGRCPGIELRWSDSGRQPAPRLRPWTSGGGADVLSIPAGAVSSRH